MNYNWNEYFLLMCTLRSLKLYAVPKCRSLLIDKEFQFVIDFLFDVVTINGHNSIRRSADADELRSRLSNYLNHSHLRLRPKFNSVNG